jgi:hypothetical protein
MVKFASVILPSLILFSCGKGGSSNPQESSTPNNDKNVLKKEITVSSNLCKVTKNDPQDFEITCEENIKNIEFAFTQAGKGIDFDGEYNGVLYKFETDVNNNIITGKAATPVTFVANLQNGENVEIKIP